MALPEKSILVLLSKNTRVYIVTFPSDLESQVNVEVATSAI